MSYNQYELNVISQHSNFKGKSLKKYNFAGQDYVGVWGNEPFKIVFKNNTWNKVQVKLSIDGTDILTGKPADTQVNGEMWVVQGYGTLSLEAWPETNKNGAQFIFTSAEKSVAVNTHGDVSSRGVIAAAVYTEGYNPLPRLELNRLVKRNSADKNYFNTNTTDYTYKQDDTIDTIDLDYYRLTDDISCSTSPSNSRIDSAPLRSLAAVGAGQQIQQNIESVAGLVNPILGPIVRVRYEWWDDLVKKCRAEGPSPSTGSGFPGEEKRIMSLGSTPRINTSVSPKFLAPEFTRF